MSSVTKTIRKIGKTVKRILPVKIKTSGWNEAVLSAFGPAAGMKSWFIAEQPTISACGPAAGMRNWLITEQPTIEPKSVNADNTIYTFKKPIKVFVKGKVLTERDGKIFMELDPTYAGLLSTIEDYVLESGGKACLLDYGVADNYQTKSKIVWTKDEKQCATLKAKWFEGRYTKPYLNGEETTSLPNVEELDLEYILQIYGLWATEDKSVAGVLYGISAYNLLTE